MVFRLRDPRSSRRRRGVDKGGSSLAAIAASSEDQRQYQGSRRKRAAQADPNRRSRPRPFREDKVVYGVEVEAYATRHRGRSSGWWRGPRSRQRCAEDGSIRAPGRRRQPEQMLGASRSARPVRTLLSITDISGAHVVLKNTVGSTATATVGSRQGNCSQPAASRRPSGVAFAPAGRYDHQEDGHYCTRHCIGDISVKWTSSDHAVIHEAAVVSDALLSPSGWSHFLTFISIRTWRSCRTAAAADQLARCRRARSTSRYRQV